MDVPFFYGHTKNYVELSHAIEVIRTPTVETYRKSCKVVGFLGFNLCKKEVNILGEFLT